MCKTNFPALGGIRTNDLLPCAYADRQGAKRAVQIGLAAAAAAGLLYLLSLRFVGAPFVSVGILLAGRAVLGAAEALIITGATILGGLHASARITPAR